MNKTKYLGISLALAATLAACSTNDFDSAPAVNGNGMITAITPTGSGTTTRTSYSQEGSDLTATWNASDEKMYTLNTTAEGWTAGQLIQADAATDNNTKANFNAYDVEGTKQVGYKAGKLFAFYPQNATAASSFKSLASDGSSVSVPLTLDGQTGKLADLSKYDYMTATSSVSENNTVEALQMKHEIAVLHINKGIETLAENGTITKIEVSATGMKTTGAMTITRNGSDITSAVAGTGSDASLIINNCSYTVKDSKLDDDIYLAILPGTMTNLKMKFTINGDEYDFDYKGSTSSFEAGKVYNWSPTYSVDKMKFTVAVSSSNGLGFNIPFPTTGSTPAKITINWGDGKTDVVEANANLSSSDKFNHTYASAGTYTVTINTAQTDPSKKQIPMLNFGKNRTGNKNVQKLKSIDTWMLNMGETDFTSLFDGATNLTSVNDDAFRFNTQITNLAYAFQKTSIVTLTAKLLQPLTELTSLQGTFCQNSSMTKVESGAFDSQLKVTDMSRIFGLNSKLTSLPSGLFDKNTLVTTFNRAFMQTGLKSVLEGLLAKNLNVTDFNSVFGNCYYLKLNSKIFINADSEKKTRFNNVTKVINFGNMFQSVGNSITNGDYGTCPDLWNYTYSSAGYGWKRTYSSSSGYTYYFPFYGSTYWQQQASSLGKGWANTENGDSNWHAQSN